MNHRLPLLTVVIVLATASSLRCSSQEYTTSAPDGRPGATVDRGCVSSQFFDFSYQLPEGMSLRDMSDAPNGGVDPTHKNFVLFMAVRPRTASGDVIDAAAEDRHSAKDQSAASWMRALHNLNATRPDVPGQADVESLKIGGREVARLRFRQSRSDGIMTYETAYAFGVRGYVVYFILASVDEGVLGTMEASMNTLSTQNECSTGK